MIAKSFRAFLQQMCTILLLSLTLMYLLQSFAFQFTSNLRSEWVFVPTCSDGAAATMWTGPGSPDNVWPLYLPATTAPPLSASARTPEHPISATEHPYPWKTERKEEVRNKDSESLLFCLLGPQCLKAPFMLHFHFMLRIKFYNICRGLIMWIILFILNCIFHKKNKCLCKFLSILDTFVAAAPLYLLDWALFYTAVRLSLRIKKKLPYKPWELNKPYT